MKIIRSCIVGIISLFLLITGVNCQVITESRKVNEFHAIHVDENININLVQSDSEKVEIRAEKNLIDSVKTKVDKGVLFILNKNHNFPEVKPVVKVYVTTLTSIRTITGSNVTSSGTFTINLPPESPFPV